MTPADRQLIKHAQKELVALVGGIDAAAAFANYGRSTVGRWADVGDPSLMPLPAILTLRRACRTPVVTAALAAADNRLLGDPVGVEGGQCVFTAMAETMVAAGSLSGVYGLALADNRVTPAELSQVDEALARLQRDLTGARRAVAAARAEGGLKVVGAGT